MQLETVPYLIDNPEVGYVQARWIFANPDECYLTKVRQPADGTYSGPQNACAPADFDKLGFGKASTQEIDEGKSMPSLGSVSLYALWIDRPYFLVSP